MYRQCRASSIVRALVRFRRVSPTLVLTASRLTSPFTSRIHTPCKPSGIGVEAKVFICCCILSERMSVRSRTSDEIDVISSSDDGEPGSILARAPITIRGIGHITMFGLNSRFDTVFPSELTGRVAPEEFSATLSRINSMLKRHVHVSSRWLLCGLLFCCCSFGCSLWPVVCLNRRTVNAVEKCLDHENISLYNKLGLHWRLRRKSMDSSQRLTEYVLELQILPKAPLLLPD